MTVALAIPASRAAPRPPRDRTLLLMLPASAVVAVGLVESEGGCCEDDTQYRRRSAGSRQ